MGVLGLTTFIARDSKRYMNDVKLKNTCVVIDGNCVASHLYKWCTKRDSAFGGDYDEYYAIVKNFFLTLKKCHITSIVVFDGGYENKKLKTVLSRLKKKLFTLKVSFSKGFSHMKFFPLYMRHIFCEVLTKMNIMQIQCEFEADGEIAALARVLNCPVLSYDSDFFIYDALYIPFSTVELECSLDEANSSFGLSCSMYNIEEFLKEYPGLQKNHLPLLATLLGNDFVNGHIFSKFFHQIPLPKCKNMSNSERKILGLLQWMTHETELSAIEKIKSHIGKTRHKDFTEAIEITKSNYSVLCNCKINSVSEKTTVYPPAYCQLPISGDLVTLLAHCKLPSFIINLIVLRTYFMPLQVEDLKQESSHTSAFSLIKATDQLLCSLTGESSNLTIFIRHKQAIKEHIVINEPLQNDSCVMEESNQSRETYLFHALQLNDEDQKVATSFLPESQLFTAAFISWCKLNRPSVCHAHALLLGFIACQAKSRVGSFRVGKQNSFSAEEVTSITNLFAPYRKTTEMARQTYQVSTVHSFNSFQSILYHSEVLNTILRNPISPCRVADSYSGTLFYNIFATLERGSDVVKSVNHLIAHNDKLCRFHDEIYKSLYRYFKTLPNTTVVEKRKRKRKVNKEKLSVIESNDTESPATEPEECLQSDYEDICNKFYLLST